MNIRQLSQTASFVDLEREWVSTLHTGINDQSLSKLTAGVGLPCLPPKRWTEIEKLIKDLYVNTNQRDAILTKVRTHFCIFSFNV